MSLSLAMVPLGTRTVKPVGRRADIARRWRGLALAVALLAPLPAHAHGGYATKADFLYKFASFVEWPGEVFSAPSSPLTLCVVGYDPFKATLDRALRGRKVGGRPLVAKRIDKADPAAGCHIAYIGGSRTESVTQALTAFNGAPVLTVTDQDMGRARGAIHFVLQNRRVRFHIDDDVAARNRVAISSKLMRLALSVRQRKTGGA